MDGDTRPQGNWFDMGSDEFSFEGPVIRVYPDSFHVTCIVGNQAGDEELIITNAGMEDLSYSIDPGSQYWLTLDGELEGVLAHDDTARILLRFESEELETGRYSDTIRITTNATQLSIIDIPVVLLICHGILNVPSDFETIQAGLDAAVNGDTVLVAVGTFTGAGNTDLDYSGKAVTVMSEAGPDKTVIDCAGVGRGVSFDSYEGFDSRLQGLTIRNGCLPDDYGGGIYCIRADPTINSCIISGNEAKYGGGIYCNHSLPSITDCIISGNKAEYGGGFRCNDSSPDLTICILTGNMARSGAAFQMFDYSEPVITNCIIAGNSSEYDAVCIFGQDVYAQITNCTITYNSGGGIYGCEDNHTGVRNCILWHNSPYEIKVESGSYLTVRYSDIQDGWGGMGNIDSDPLYSIYMGFDYILRTGSSCIDAGDPDITDYLYDRHPLCPDWYVNGSRSDMGAYGGPGNIFWFTKLKSGKSLELITGRDVSKY